jgi:hypothetical protein
MTKKNPYTAQQMLEGIDFNKALTTVNGKETWLFQIFVKPTKGPLLERKYTAEPVHDDRFMASEISGAMRRLVMAAKLVEDTSDEDLKALYEAKFGKGDGL